MEYLFKTLLVLHIAGGATGLLAGTLNIIRKKGDKPHVQVGRFFFYGMLLAGLTALVMALMHPNHFLFIVGVFTLYMLGTGQRYLSLRQLHKGQQVSGIDWALTGTMAVFGILFGVFGGWQLLQGNDFGFVFWVFGGVGLRFVWQDWQNYRRKGIKSNTWIIAHLQRMTGTYIASLTAFLVVNITFLPPVLTWLLPSLLVSPLITIWSRAQRRRVA
ncbi:MAG TPA: hypothetical protein DCM08_09115 [Microscillaceae bacterium]|jgi:uncharacterized membrane protein|nr:hypothetical protein [Microscillaceae bacterium]